MTQKMTKLFVRDAYLIKYCKSGTFRMLKFLRISDFGTLQLVNYHFSLVALLSYSINFREILKFANLCSLRNSHKLKPRWYYQTYINTIHEMCIFHK